MLSLLPRTLCCLSEEPGGEALQLTLPLLHRVVSGILGDLKAQALDMNAELDEQDEQLEVIQKKMQSDDDRVTHATDRANVLLKTA